VFPHPNGTVTSEFREELVNYVASGGKVFILDSMGVTGDVIPDDELRKVFDLQFAIFKDIVSEP